MNKKTITIGLAGNPNTGKTTLFNAITGAHQKVGNYAGVTVEKKEGKRAHNGYELILYDLPGIYSLTAYSIDEIITRDFLLHEKPDIVIDVLDSTNTERNLYLCLQFQELGIPVLGALNVADQAEEMGITIDEKGLSALLGIAFIKTVGTNGAGVEELLDAAIELAENPRPANKRIAYGAELEAEIEKIAAAIAADRGLAGKYPARWLAIKLLEKDTNAGEIIRRYSDSRCVSVLQESGIQRIEKHFGNDAEIIVSEQRYGYIRGAIKESVTRKENTVTRTEMIDTVLLNRYAGLPIFIFIMWLIFQTTFTLGEYPMAWLESLFGWLSSLVVAAIPDGLVRSLMADGIIAGVGGVFSFVPLVMILFLCISFLEDTGYMARAAFIMDKFLHMFGLHGQSFVPLMLGFGCSVPAIMAARTLKNTRDRLITILITPFMSCGAKLPVHVLLAGAFFASNPGNVVLLIYLIGAALALVSALLLRRVVFQGDAAPFVMELPPYRMPSLQGMMWHVKDKTWQYLKRAGTVILGVSLLVWFITSFPRSPAQAGINNEQALERSYAGKLGKMIEPVLQPLGFDWKIGIATITGFAAKEVVVSTLGVLYKVGEEETEESEPLREALRNDRAFSPLVGFTLMLFMLLMPPCIAALAVIRAELGWKWLAFSVLFSLSVAWITSFVVYQAGHLW